MRLLLIGFFLCYSVLTLAETVLPSDSIYQVGGTWQTQDNEYIQLDSLMGKPQLIALIFTGCSNSCPIIVESMKEIEKQVPIKMRSKIGFVLVSITPDTDYPKALKSFAEKRGLNSNWKLLRGNNESVRAISNSLNGRYKVAQDGDVTHSNSVTLLNNKGQIQIQAIGTLTGIKPILNLVERNYSNTNQ